MQRSLVAQPGTRIVTNGVDLLSQFQPERGHAVVSSSLYDHEILSVPRRRPANAPFRVAFVGFLRPEKGIDTLLAAFHRLLDEIPSAELFIVGPKAPVERGTSMVLEQALAALRERGTVHTAGFHGYGPELFQAFADADVLAVPSRSEGTPRVLVEARAFGCTVVASKVGGIPTSIEHEVDGLLVPPGDAEALAAALVRIARDRALRKRLVAAGIERARRTTVDRFADSIIAEAQLAAEAGARVAHDTTS
jgi:glycosyltransferase involved in cell wall biosynthesis